MPTWKMPLRYEPRRSQAGLPPVALRSAAMQASMRTVFLSALLAPVLLCSVYAGETKDGRTTADKDTSVLVLERQEFLALLKEQEELNTAIKALIDQRLDRSAKLLDSLAKLDQQVKKEVPEPEAEKKKPPQICQENKL